MSTMEAPLFLIVLWPLLGALAAYPAGLKNPAFSGWIASTCSFLSFVCTLYLGWGIPPEDSLVSTLFTWLKAGDLLVELQLRLDRLSFVMCLVVTGVGTLIHFYSIDYMGHDDSRPRFFSYLNLFMFCMLILVLSANLPVMFIGWEGVGLCSYLLIGFWFRNEGFARAGRKAFVVTRIGDTGFLIAIFALYLGFGTLDFEELKELIAGHGELSPFLYLVAAGLFFGAIGKSAQIPLFVWLPDAMAGPTPVSALIHAATMVTAGVYMMARLHFIFALAEPVMAVVLLVAVLTAFLAATIALAQNDIKKVLAYSTISQLRQAA